VIRRRLTFSQIMTPVFFLGLLPASSLLSSPAPAQVGGGWETTTIVDAYAHPGLAGSVIARAGDLDGDGFQDILVGSDDEDGPVGDSSGGARAYSGWTGALLWMEQGAARNDLFGSAVAAAGDLDGDGVDDFLVGAIGADPTGLTDAGSVFLYSGATGAQLNRFDGTQGGAFFGSPLAAGSDFDGDGSPDFLVGSGGLGFPVELRSGTTGAILRSHPVSHRIDSLAIVGDLDGDGTDDYIIGDSGASLSTEKVVVYSGKTGRVLHQLPFPGGSLGFGVAVAGSEDVNGDGVADLLVGGPAQDARDLGAAFLYSGLDGSLLRRIDGSDQFFGQSLVDPGDVDGDGTPDLLIGSPTADTATWSSAGRAALFSGASGALLDEWFGATAGDYFGMQVANAGDTDGGGRDDLLVKSMVMGYWPGMGSVYRLSFSPYLQSNSDEISASSGVPVQFDLDFPETEAGFFYLLLASTSGTGPTTLGSLDVPLTSDSLFQQLLSGWSPPLLHRGQGYLDLQGRASALLDSSPSLAPAIGATLHLAAITYDPRTMTGRLSSMARALSVVP